MSQRVAHQRLGSRYVKLLCVSYKVLICEDSEGSGCSQYMLMPCHQVAVQLSP